MIVEQNLCTCFPIARKKHQFCTVMKNRVYDNNAVQDNDKWAYIVFAQLITEAALGKKMLPRVFD